jgi:hypothetical protein
VSILPGNPLEMEGYAVGLPLVPSNASIDAAADTADAGRFPAMRLHQLVQPEKDGMVARVERDGEDVEDFLGLDYLTAIMIDAAAQSAYWGEPRIVQQGRTILCFLGSSFCRQLHPPPKGCHLLSSP